MPKFTFINHASYIVETNMSLLLVDPWVEGGAFDNGWSLLDQSISNSELVDFISATKKKKYIWLSHEHSDHFSVPFLRKLREKEGDKITFIFQKTLDGRVANFIRKIGFKVIESNDTLEIIDSEMSIVTFPYEGGDSYCLTKLKNFSILNINDCVLSDEKSINSVLHNYKKYTDNIDLLLTQFGYANWVGNKDESNLREISAREKLDRISLQVKKFCPKSLIPFASFVYFSHKDNFHTNDSQNTPRDVATLFDEHDFNSNLIILKPWDQLDLKQDLYEQNTNRELNIRHWVKLFKNIEPKVIDVAQFSIDEIKSEYKVFRSKIFKCFLVMPFLIELFKFIKPLNIYVHDLKSNVLLSFVKGIRIVEGDKLACDISISSSTLIFILKYEYGINTTMVNGKFERISTDGTNIFVRHFSPQEYMKMGYGFNRPFITTWIIAGKFLHKIFRSTISN